MLWLRRVSTDGKFVSFPELLFGEQASACRIYSELFISKIVANKSQGMYISCFEIHSTITDNVQILAPPLGCSPWVSRFVKVC